MKAWYVQVQNYLADLCPPSREKLYKLIFFSEVMKFLIPISVSMYQNTQELHFKSNGKTYTTDH